jgi:hypothetical protein
MRTLAWTSGVIFTSPAEVEKVCVWAKAAVPTVSMARVRRRTVCFMEDIVGGGGAGVKGR